VPLNLFHIFKAQVYYIQGELDLALKMAQLAQGNIQASLGLLQAAEHHFFYSLILIKHYEKSNGWQKNQTARIIKRNRRKLKKWAKDCPENFSHKYNLVKAEWARVTGEKIEAMHLYDHAIDLAAKFRFIQVEALANELAAEFYLSQGVKKAARAYLLEAGYAFHLWGATLKSKALEKKLQEISNQDEERAYSSEKKSRNQWLGNAKLIDVQTVIKASQALSSEIELKKLLRRLMDILMENAGANKGCFILKRNEELFVEAERFLGEEKSREMQSTPLDKHTQLCKGIVNVCPAERCGK